MKSITCVAAIAALCVVASSVEASAACKANYYNGEGHASTWQQGRKNARGDWSYKIKNKFGKSWSYWSKAKVRDESCNRARGWPYDQWCNVEAYPCK